MSVTLRVAVVGLGNIGRNHATTYQKDSLSDLVAVCDMDRSRADAAAQQFKVPAYYDLGELLAKELLSAAIEISHCYRFFWWL